MKTKMSAEELRLVSYFLEEKDVSDYVKWDEVRESVLSICPLLALYLDAQRNADMLRNAALKELDDVIYRLEEAEE